MVTAESPPGSPAANAQRGASPQKWTIVILACVAASLFALLIAQIMPMLSTTPGVHPRHFFPEKVLLLEKQTTQSGG